MEKIIFYFKYIPAKDGKTKSLSQTVPLQILVISCHLLRLLFKIDTHESKTTYLLFMLEHILYVSESERACRISS